MNESAKTGIYAVIALAALGIAWLARPATVERKTFDDANERFFDQFDPLAAKGLEIVSYNTATSSLNAFNVAQVNGRWSIPSHENYPADAQDHLAQAATSVMDLKKGPKVSDSPSEHELYGLLDPTAAGAGLGSGTRVTLKDEAGKPLVDLIIGKQVNDPQKLHQDPQNLRYVRVPGKDRVYSVAVKTEQLTTKFEDWIERDLLKLQSNLIKDVVIDDYSVDELNNRLIRGDKLVIHWNPIDNKWSMEGLAAGEALQTEKLDQLRAALSDLKIVDVHRKPAGLSAQLAANGSVPLTNEAMASLLSAGYYMAELQPGKRELLSNQGEMSFRTSEGVEYTLRFGELVIIKGQTDLNKPDSQADQGNENGRYVFVTTAFNSGLIDPPKEQPVPDAPAPPASQPDGTPGALDPAAQAMQKAHDDAVAANDKSKAEWDKKVADGQEKVKQLNSRFADWYYVVPDSVYQKLKLKRADLAGPPRPPASTGNPAGPMPMPMPGAPGGN